MKTFLKTKNFQNCQCGNHRTFDLYKVLTSAGAGKSVFSVFYEKAGNSPKFTKLMEIRGISINLVEKSSFLPEAEKSGNTQSES